MLRPVPVKDLAGVELGSREPVFDITISAAKKSTFSRLTQKRDGQGVLSAGIL